MASTSSHIPHIPTPSTRSRGLPTPETQRRTSKRPGKQPHHAEAGTSLPTPETVPRKRRAHDDSTHTVSPNGETTFVHEAQAASQSRDRDAIRRRPGLTFAAQMGLVAGQPQAGPSRGLGIGMGGARTGGHKVDRISLPPSEGLDDNPFVVTEPHESTKLASPIPPSKTSLRSPPALITDPVHSAFSLLSPPPTQRAPRIRQMFPTVSPRTSARQKAEREKVERLKRKRDESDNPFLVQPGQRAKHRPAAIVDESRPLVTYVFRGAKKEFVNPFIDPETHIPEAELSVDDEEYEPHPCPKPKLLWPTAPTPPKLSTPRRRVAFSEDEGVSPPPSPIPTPRGKVDPAKGFVSDDEFLPVEEEEEGNDELPVRRGLLFGAGAGAMAVKHELEEKGTPARRKKAKIARL